jgi:hypothetical protein
VAGFEQQNTGQTGLSPVQFSIVLRI